MDLEWLLVMKKEQLVSGEHIVVLHKYALIKKKELSTKLCFAR